MKLIKMSYLVYSALVLTIISGSSFAGPSATVLHPGESTLSEGKNISCVASTKNSDYFNASDDEIDVLIGAGKIKCFIYCLKGSNDLSECRLSSYSAQSADGQYMNRKYIKVLESYGSSPEKEIRTLLRLAIQSGICD